MQICIVVTGLCRIYFLLYCIVGSSKVCAWTLVIVLGTSGFHGTESTLYCSSLFLSTHLIIDNKVVRHGLAAIAIKTGLYKNSDCAIDRVSSEGVSENAINFR